MKDDGSISFALSNGTKLEGRLHSSLTLSDARDLVGRTLDLEAAYKQLPVSDATRWTAALKVSNVELQEDQLFVCEVLPFGASAAVYAFNRFARSLRVIGTRLFSIMWSNYFDDFPQLDIRAMRDDSQFVAEKFLSLLGWKVSAKETKRKPFAKVYEALGVQLDFSQTNFGRVCVSNKPSRIDSIDELVSSIAKTLRCDE